MRQSQQRQPSTSKPLQALTSAEIPTVHLSKQGQNNSLQRQFQGVLQESENKFAPEGILRLGILYLEKGEPLQTIKRFESALSALEKDKVSVKMSETGLYIAENQGVAYMNLDKWDKEKQMFQHAYRGFKKVHSSTRESTLPTLNHLGILFMKQGRFRKAESTFDSALQLEDVSTRKKLPMLCTTSNLGML
ncbi:tetratricopeptide repeat protein [Aspergillus tanneri]|nr:uncharacterized protein ATNIH1004_004327 [Aspergillus tanneri]KAA8648442.1 hypothetical protein ATNIH1004_004327 [Aspergillus tanneri]